jgi:hypothetical protein
MTQKLFEISGIGKDRLHLYWVSSAEAQRFVEVVKTVTDSILAQGPFDAEASSLQLAAAERTLASETIRWAVGKEVKITTKGDVYKRRWDADTYESILYRVLEREYQVNLILSAIQKGCAAPRDIRDKTGLELRRISYLLADMEKRSLVEFKGMDACKPIFAAI